MALKDFQLEEYLQKETAIGRKIYENVPMSEPWKIGAIIASMSRQTGTSADYKIVEGCLKNFVDNKIVRKVKDGYIRTPVVSKPKKIVCMGELSTVIKEKTTIPTPDMAKTILKIPGASNVSASQERKDSYVFDELAEIGNSMQSIVTGMQALAEQVEAVSKRVDALAIVVTEESEEISKLRQLKQIIGSLSK